MRRDSPHVPHNKQRQIRGKQMFSLYYNRSYLQTRLALKFNYECEKQTIKSSELVC